MGMYECTQCRTTLTLEGNDMQAAACPQCGGRLAPYPGGMPGPAAEQARERPRTEAKPQPYPLAFLGSSEEFFRIWIVNLFLTVITLGIYAAWAKVRTRQYFYANTRLAGYQFDYLANPYAILKGNLIIAGAFITYTAVNYLAPAYSAALFVPFGLLLPFLIYKSLRFFAGNSAYRNIRFRFNGTLQDSYRVYLLWPLLTGMTLGMLYPSWAYRRKQYFLDNTAYGTTRSTFSGASGPFYKTYLKASLLFILAYAAFFALIGAVVGVSAGIHPDPAAVKHPEIKTLVLMVLFTVFFFIPLLSLTTQYAYVRLTNYSWESTRLGKIRFRSTLTVRELLWIHLTNILAMIFSLGLLIPWAMVRRTRYIMEHMVVYVPGNLDEFAADHETRDTAVGDSAADFFDLEIGL